MSISYVVATEYFLKQQAMTAKTIDEVVEQLDAIIDDARHERSRLGFFAALYRRVTVEVRDGIAAGRFEDGPRMERFDVISRARCKSEIYSRGLMISSPLYPDGGWYPNSILGCDIAMLLNSGLKASSVYLK